MPKRFVDKCVDRNGCWNDNSPPMIHDELWTAIGMKKDGLLCDVCFRKRLNRPLRIADLRNCPFNDMWFVLTAVCNPRRRNYSDKNQKQFVSAAKLFLTPTDVVSGPI
jgi:hypothetical protein